ncbi:nucleotide sugar dehydrogenase [Beijerinckia indica]|uniref:UDP-glucose 6-dehydrogenase n=1 Tax=Beijerinckia indica subsp. indica (strain ATCC 9039 / DSM 1715 / NCIMB 8712) TaxID=395963 RepID=B2ILL4_BEII9|nr:nucleotide sugar dehydrogenase [Beijerinckia indica]ACB97414.1 nucleotide sugar dehydrogenase [Beijerinckia indica subsp. indica ATCC 9039]
MKIAIYGLGYVGLTAAGCLTKEGHWVLGVDVSEDKIRQIAEGTSPIKEPGLAELLQQAVTNNLIKCTSNPGNLINECDMAIVCVGTPSGPDGAHNMSYIAEVSRQIAHAVDPDRKDPLTVVFRSTIRPGTIEELILPIFRSVLDSKINAVELVYNPEFLREAVAINDFFNPPKIVIGTFDGKPCANMDKMNQNLKAPVFYTRYREAEFTKFVDNTFHAVKVSFANEIGRVCLQLGISAQKVHEIFVSDTKLNISPYYLRPGGPFGGSCLPKDVRALQYISSDAGAHTHLIDSLLRSNEAHKHYLFEYCLKGVPKDAHILMLGLAFKYDSDDLRESPKVDLARKILVSGYRLSIYDPALKPRDLIGQNLGYVYSQLPNLEKLLVSQSQIEQDRFAVVIDTNGSAKTLKLTYDKFIDINALA